MNHNLAPGERILWQGEPVAGPRFTAQDIFAIPFTIVWLGMVTFMAFGFATSEATSVDPMGLFILPIFLAVGLYMLVGRFIIDMLVTIERATTEPF